jgi:hypothetical protein
MMQMMSLAADELLHPFDAEGHCLGWAHNGTAIVIRDQERFSNEVLPRFFNSCKFNSFRRKLQRWGFHQVSKLK